MCFKAHCGDKSKPRPSITQACQYLWAPPAQGPTAEDTAIFRKMADVISHNMELQLAAHFEELRLDGTLANARVLRQQQDEGAQGNIQDEVMPMKTINTERRK